MHVTWSIPIGKTLPDAGTHPEDATRMLSEADDAYVTAVPIGPVAFTVKSAGTLRFGDWLSCCATKKGENELVNPQT
jgi:hypothetical protein